MRAQRQAGARRAAPGRHRQGGRGRAGPERGGRDLPPVPDLRRPVRGALPQPRARGPQHDVRLGDHPVRAARAIRALASGGAADAMDTDRSAEPPRGDAALGGDDVPGGHRAGAGDRAALPVRAGKAARRPVAGGDGAVRRTGLGARRGARGRRHGSCGAPSPRPPCSCSPAGRRRARSPSRGLAQHRGHWTAMPGAACGALAAVCLALAVAAAAADGGRRRAAWRPPSPCWSRSGPASARCSSRSGRAWREARRRSPPARTCTHGPRSRRSIQLPAGLRRPTAATTSSPSPPRRAGAALGLALIAAAALVFASGAVGYLRRPQRAAGAPSALGGAGAGPA